MGRLDEVITEVHAQVADQIEAQLRERLRARDHDWLVEALVEQALRQQHPAESSARQLTRLAHPTETPAARRKRLERIRARPMDPPRLREEVSRYQALDRARLIAEGLLADPPHKGLAALDTHHRTPRGEDLLQEVHDLFYALLFCDEDHGVRLRRTRRDFLTVTLPSPKAACLENFLLAVTETQVAGTWLDPEGVSDDVGAMNTVLQVEFGDTRDELVSEALVALLRLINELEVNEEILYARIERIQRSTLVQ